MKTEEEYFIFLQLINAQNKMKEMYNIMDSVNEWIDDGQGLMKEYKEDMSEEESESLKKRAQVHLRRVGSSNPLISSNISNTNNRRSFV